MKWYRGYYGSWNDAKGVRMIEGTFDRKEMYQRAQRVANDLGVVVTVEMECPTACGMRSYFDEVRPSR